MQRQEPVAQRPILLALAGTLIILVLALGSRAQAANRLFQTIPTPTPRTIPSVSGDADPTQMGDGSAQASPLAVSQVIAPVDILPDEELSSRFQVTNITNDEVRDVIFANPLPAMLRPLEIRSTQGAARVQGQSIVVDLGSIEAGQTVVVILRAKVVPDAEAGQVVVNQATVHFDGGQVGSEVAAAGLPPDRLPATGQDRSLPQMTGPRPHYPAVTQH